jgi:Carboxypeptidase regulatory-like domain
MIGDERVRYCPECKLNVYNFSAMPEHEIRRLVAKREGRLCARWYRKTDGTVLTADCPVGFRARVRRISLVAGTALSAFMGVGTAKAQQKGDTSSPSASPSLVQIDKARQGDGMILVRVMDPSGAVIPGVDVSVKSMPGTLVSTHHTDSRGEVKVLNLKSGHYSVQVAMEGFVSAAIENLEVIPGHVTETKVELQVGSVVMGGPIAGDFVELSMTPATAEGIDAIPLVTVPQSPNSKAVHGRVR